MSIGNARARSTRRTARNHEESGTQVRVPSGAAVGTIARRALGIERHARATVLQAELSVRVMCEALRESGISAVSTARGAALAWTRSHPPILVSGDLCDRRPLMCSPKALHQARRRLEAAGQLTSADRSYARCTVDPPHRRSRRGTGAARSETRDAERVFSCAPMEHATQATVRKRLPGRGTGDARSCQTLLTRCDAGWLAQHAAVILLLSLHAVVCHGQNR